MLVDGIAPWRYARGQRWGGAVVVDPSCWVTGQCVGGWPSGQSMYKSINQSGNQLGASSDDSGARYTSVTWLGCCVDL